MIEGIISAFGKLGCIGITITMFLGSSIIPLPSEAILWSMGASPLNLLNAALCGSIGLTFGSIVVYLLGKKWGKVFVRKFGKYFFLTEGRVEAIDRWFGRYGKYSTFVARIIPFVPHKVYSIVAGIFEVDFRDFLLFTFMGSLPRCLFLMLWGKIAFSVKNLPVIILSLVLVSTLPLIFEKVIKRRRFS